MLSQFILYMDSPYAYQLGFQDPATYNSELIINIHYHIMYIMIFILFFVSYYIYRLFIDSLINKTVGKKLEHDTFLEIIWTIIPIFIILIILVPTFNLLYSLDTLVSPNLTLKIIGHQWYWSYEYCDYDFENPIIFDSCLIPTDELNIGDLRLLEVDNRIVLPVNTNIRLLITSADVLHCWTIPSFGVKMDAAPGRLNEINLNITRTGTFYGQCSEICGVNHGFMPIVVEVVSTENYINWLIEKANDL